MKITDFGFVMPKRAQITIAGFDEANMQPTSIKDSDGNPYFLAKLLEPVNVGCSVMGADFPEQTIDEIYVREAAVAGDMWEPRDAAKFEELKKKNKLQEYKGGYFAKEGDKEWIGDFSKNQEIFIYQNKTIAQWARDNRGEQGKKRDTGILQRLKERQANKG